MKTSRTGLTGFAMACAAALAFACAPLEVLPPADPAPPPPGAPEPGLYQVVGTLTDEGVECPALRDDAGRLFTFAGDLQGFQAGDRVRVTGRVAEMAICQQGTTLTVERIERA